MASRQVTVAQVFETSGYTFYQLMVCFLCFLVMVLDGFDLMVIGVALPKMAAFMHVKPGALGLALSAGQFGPLVGSVVLGMLGDRFGRKWMLLISALFFGLFSLTTAAATSPEQVALYRFLAGLGLGGAIPNALAFGSEYAPPRARTIFVTTMLGGVPFGSMLGALSAVFLLPYYDWQSLFIVGGALPLIVGLVLMFFLPESLGYLVAQGDKYKAKARAIISKIAPALAADPEVEFVSTGEKLAGVPVKHLFMEGRALTTILLWLGVIGSLYSLWVLGSWLPTLLHQVGATVRQYSWAFACLHGGSVVAFVIIGRIMDKVNPFRVLMVSFLLGAVSLVVFGYTAGGSFALTIAMSLICGAFINASNGGLLALATLFYPVQMRSTGIGWAYAVAKVGAMLAPAVGGYMLVRNWSVPRICSSQALVGVLVAVIVLLLSITVRRAAKAAAVPPAAAK
jgi:AAHS family 4-hydroxybenzoate transporter-like MFS transporter